MATYHKLPTGEWVALGPGLELGPVELHKRGGGTCPRVVDEIAIDVHGHRIGYLTEHCQAASRAAHDRRKAAAS